MSELRCPIHSCRVPMRSQERRPNGNAVCFNGHKTARTEWRTLYGYEADRADELQKVANGADRHYATLRTALRYAALRVVNTNGRDVSPIFRAIEEGMSLSDATNALEAWLRDLRSAEPFHSLNAL